MKKREVERIIQSISRVFYVSRSAASDPDGFSHNSLVEMMNEIEGLSVEALSALGLSEDDVLQDECGKTHIYRNSWDPYADDVDYSWEQEYHARQIQLQ